ncbi:hypothetical protein BDA99DRAFT_590912 [Phascolomyces articulosus]|uniref:F-box domain-containing protein n=1 Tax=Phascolomyces articulosus TaxID=60185 RepID=A0AAD5PHV2_9FUNG|nr:hypothetical protein BDA99DRAFT_590912 [Phascolomyces articulosus]
MNNIHISKDSLLVYKQQDYFQDQDYGMGKETLLTAPIVSTSTNMVASMDFILGLPAEIQGIIFSDLTLRERIRCTSVCKGWRSVILGDSRMWHTLTNEGYRYELYPVLTTFESFIHGNSIRAVDFTLKNHRFDTIQAITNDINRVFELFETWNCNCIERARFAFSCYDKRWFKKFQILARDSLTHLSLLWDVYPEIDDNAFPSFVIRQFPNLSHFIVTMEEMSCWYRPSYFIKQQLHRLLMGNESIEEYANNNNNSLLPLILQRSKIECQHKSLTSICINICEADFALPFPEYLLKLLPTLKHIKFCTNGCTSTASVKQFHETLVKYCHYIETLSFICKYPVDYLIVSSNDTENETIDYRFISKIDSLFHHDHFTVLSSNQHHPSLKIFRLCGNWATNAMQHLLCVIPCYHHSLEILELTCGLLQECLAVLAKFEFPRLQKFMFEPSNNFQQSSSTSTHHGCNNNNYAKTMNAFFKQTKCIKYIFLKNVRITDDIIKFLCYEHNRTLETLILRSCHGMTDRCYSYSGPKLYHHASSSNST